jgi:tetratricopeptide (TPR) repeat protein
MVWADFESALSGDRALSAAKRIALLSFAARLVDTAGLRLIVVVDTPAEEPVVRFSHPAFDSTETTTQLKIERMETAVAVDYAARLLTSRDRPLPAEADLARLVEYVNGHYRSVRLAVMMLEEHNNDVIGVIIALERMQDGLTPTPAPDMTIDLSRLRETADPLVESMGVFAYGALDFAIPPVADIPNWPEIRDEVMEDFKALDWVTQRNLSISASLFGILVGIPVPEKKAEERVAIPAYRFHPAIIERLRREKPPDSETIKRYIQFYDVFSGRLLAAHEHMPDAALRIFEAALPNFLSALDRALNTGNVYSAADFAVRVETLLSEAEKWKTLDLVFQRVTTALQTADEGPVFTRPEYQVKSRYGEHLMEQGKAAEAEKFFLRLLPRMEGKSDYDATLDVRKTRIRLGRSRIGQKKYKEALADFQAVVEIPPDETDPESMRIYAEALAGTADVHRARQNIEAARIAYKKALAVHKSLSDVRAEGLIYNRIGDMESAAGNFKAAKNAYKTALTKFTEIDNMRLAAVTWFRLGEVAEAQAKRETGAGRRSLLDDAASAYTQSFTIKESEGWIADAAANAGHLAGILQLAGRVTEAYERYRQAIDLFLGKNLPAYAAIAMNNLADMLLTVHLVPANRRPVDFADRDLLSEAERWANRAREYKELDGNPALEPWVTYRLLARIAAAQNNPKEEARWKMRERVSFAAAESNWESLRLLFEPVIVLFQSAAKGDETAQKGVSKLIAELSASGGWKRLSKALTAIHQGERDAEQIARKYDLTAADYLIITKVLEALP